MPAARPRPVRGTDTVSPARLCAFVVLRRVFETGAYADRALHAAAVGMGPRDRALATRLTYGTVQRRATLDHMIERFAERPPARLQAPVLAALRLGLYQLHYAGGVADHAAVNESVALARRAGSPEGARLVNAVLRRSTREGAALLGALDDATPARAALAHSLPGWMAERWWEEMGASEARALMATVNEPAEHALRVNQLVTDTPSMLEALDADARPDSDLEEAVIVDGPFDAHGSPLFAAGAFMPQSRGSMLVARLAQPQTGMRVLDLCAAPGAKTTHLAALMRAGGTVVAVERNRGRAGTLRRTCARMHAANVRVQLADARRPVAGERFDVVTVDPPCSGLGTLQSRPDLRWRVTPERIASLVDEQAQILDAAAVAVAAGGALVYSTCTLSAVENELAVRGFLERHADFEAATVPSDLRTWKHRSVSGALLALPHRHRTDGFFVARLQRRRGGGDRARGGGILRRPA